MKCSLADGDKLNGEKPSRSRELGAQGNCVFYGMVREGFPDKVICAGTEGGSHVTMWEFQPEEQ